MSKYVESYLITSIAHHSIRAENFKRVPISMIESVIEMGTLFFRLAASYNMTLLRLFFLFFL